MVNLNLASIIFTRQGLVIIAVLAAGALALFAAHLLGKRIGGKR